MMNTMLTDHNNGKEGDVYFYHSNHLGSASWITDSAGEAVQHLQYLPYGEPYINQRLSGYNERFTFTGKGPRKGWRTPLNTIICSEQRDAETILSYFGARYYDSDLLMGWLSVDPMSDKYPCMSPYSYCASNPLKLSDPDGRKIRIVTGVDNEGDKIYTEINSIHDLPDNEAMNILRELYTTSDGEKAIAQIMDDNNNMFTILEKMDYLGDHSVDPNGDVSWGVPDEMHGGDEKSVLAEEIYHCYQISINEWKFEGMSRERKLSLEEQAKTFAANSFSYKAYWRHPDGYYIPTQMNVMSGGDNQLKKSYLRNDIYTSLPKYQNDPTFNPMEPQCGEYRHKGAY